MNQVRRDFLKKWSDKLHYRIFEAKIMDKKFARENFIIEVINDADFVRFLNK